MPGLVSVGMKRKHHALDEGGGGGSRDKESLADSNTTPTTSQDKCSSYTMQRKYVMNASICKLQATWKLIDPSLRRSVLIRNTLLHIDHELRSEGRHRDSFQLSTLIAASTQSAYVDTADKDRLPGAGTTSVLSVACDNNSNHYKDKVLYHSYSENGSICSRTSIHTYALTSLSATISSPSTTDLSMSHSVVTTNTIQPNSATNTTTSSSELTRLQVSNSEILDFGDELFSDIDMSLYDFDIATPSVPTHKSSPTVTPVSSTSDEWLRSLTGEFSFSTADSNSSSANQGSSCRSDIICDELDQIMHVLVGVGM